MATIISDTLGRRNNAAFAVASNVDVAGNWRTVADTAARDAIPAYTLVANQSVAYVQSTSTAYIWNGTAWVAIALGGGDPSLGGDASGTASNATVLRVTGQQDTTVGGTRSIMLSTLSPEAYVQLGDPNGSSAYSGIDIYGGGDIHMSTGDGHNFLMATDVLSFGGGGTNTQFSLDSGVVIQDNYGATLSSFTLRNPCTLTTDTNIDPVFYTGEVADPSTLAPPHGGWTTGSIYNYIDGADSALYLYTGGVWTPLDGGADFVAGGDLRGNASAQYVVSLTGSDVAPNVGRVVWPAATHLDLIQSGATPPPVATYGWIRSPRYSNAPYIGARTPNDLDNVSLLQLNGDQYTVGGTWYTSGVQHSHRLQIWGGDTTIETRPEQGNTSSGTFTMTTGGVDASGASSGALLIESGPSLLGPSGGITIRTGGSQSSSPGSLYLQTGQVTVMGGSATGANINLSCGSVINAVSSNGASVSVAAGAAYNGPNNVVMPAAFTLFGGSRNYSGNTKYVAGGFFVFNGGNAPDIAATNNDAADSLVSDILFTGGSGGSITQDSPFSSLTAANSRGSGFVFTAGNAGSVETNAPVVRSESGGYRFVVGRPSAVQNLGYANSLSQAGPLRFEAPRAAQAGITGNTTGRAESRGTDIAFEVGGSDDAYGSEANSTAGAYSVLGGSAGRAEGQSVATSTGFTRQITLGSGGTASSPNWAMSLGGYETKTYGAGGDAMGLEGRSRGGGLTWNFGTGGNVRHSTTATELSTIGGGIVANFGNAGTVLSDATTAEALGGGALWILGDAPGCVPFLTAARGGDWIVRAGPSYHDGPNARGGNIEHTAGRGSRVGGSVLIEGGDSTALSNDGDERTGNVLLRTGGQWGPTTLTVAYPTLQFINRGGINPLGAPSLEGGFSSFINQTRGGLSYFRQHGNGYMVFSLAPDTMSDADVVNAVGDAPLASFAFVSPNPQLGLNVVDVSNPGNPVVHPILSNAPNQYAILPNLVQPTALTEIFQSSLLVETNITGDPLGQKAVVTLADIQADRVSNQQLDATQYNNWSIAPGATFISTLRLSPTVNTFITGIAANTGGNIVTKRIYNVGPGSITFVDDGDDSQASARFITPNGSNLVMVPGAAVDIFRDNSANRWRVYLVFEPPPLVVPGGGTTIPYASITDTSINIQQNDAVFASLVGCAQSGQVNRMSAQCSQASAAGSVFFAIYNVSLQNICQGTVGIPVTTTGVKVGTIPITTLVAGEYYYFAVRCTGNGSRFAGGACSNANLTPAVSLLDNNAGLSSFPANLVIDQRIAQAPWLRVSYSP